MVLAHQKKTPPAGAEGVVVNNVPLAREERYFFFFAGAFLVAFLAAFLVAFFIEKILPKRKICNL
jgi:hypothetical protein